MKITARKNVSFAAGAGVIRLKAGEERELPDCFAQFLGDVAGIDIEGGEEDAVSKAKPAEEKAADSPKKGEVAPKKPAAPDPIVTAPKPAAKK